MFNCTLKVGEGPWFEKRKEKLQVLFPRFFFRIILRLLEIDIHHHLTDCHQMMPSCLSRFFPATLPISTSKQWTLQVHTPESRLANSINWKNKNKITASAVLVHSRVKGEENWSHGKGAMTSTGCSHYKGYGQNKTKTLAFHSSWKDKQRVILLVAWDFWVKIPTEGYIWRL